MKKLVNLMIILAAFGSSHVLASDVSDGFNWPEGFTIESSEAQSNIADGFNWPEGFSVESHNVQTDIAYGFEWPEGS